VVIHHEEALYQVYGPFFTFTFNLAPFTRKTVISVENLLFQIPVYLTPPLRGFPLKFCNGGWTKKTEMMPYENVK